MRCKSFRITVLSMLALVGAPAVANAANGRYIIAFKPGAASQGIAAAKAAGARVVLSLEEQNAAAAVMPERAVQALQRNPNVDYVEPDEIREPYALSDVTTGGETTPYGIQMVQAGLIASPDPGSRKICIIDSGYSEQQVDLADASSGAVTWTATTGTGSWNKDSCGHGTHVAGTIAAIAGNGAGVVGVVPGVRLHIVKVFGNDTLVENGSCSWTYVSTLVSALNSCVSAGANVVSMSLGGTVKSRTEDRAFADAYKKGILSIAAAGNGGNATTSYPAGYDSVVSVAAVDAAEAKASFSQTNRDVEIAAPGVAVLSTVPWNDRNTLTIGSVTWAGGRIEGAARTTGTTGFVTDGGLCTSAGAWSGRIVLCQRGTSSFADKVTAVRSGGGVAAVIYNNVASDPTCGVFQGTLGTGVTSTIPAVAISCADGASALAQTGASGTVKSSFDAPASSYEAWDGTSMATPHVSGVAALIWSCNPARTAAEVRNAIDATAKDVGARGRDTSFGYGIVQAKAALSYLGTGSCTVR